MIYIFIGTEINIVKEKINETVKSLDIENIIKYDYSVSSITEIIDEVNYVDLFNERKLIIVNDISFKKLKDKDEEKLINYINNQNDNVIIFRCVDETLDERKTLTKLFRSKCNLVVCEKLDYKTLHAYVTNMFKEEKKTISFNQVKKILDYCEYNTDVTINEVNKLLLYKIGEDVISDEDIDNVVSRSNEKEMFNLTEMVMKKDIGGCLESYKILVSSNVDSTIIVDNLAKQFRMLYQAKLLMSSLDENNLAKRLGVKTFVLKKIFSYVRSYKEEEIINILYRLSEVDSDIKLKGLDKNKVLEAFFMSL